MKIYPKISIVTPNYNGGKYLEETIKSVLSQNYPNLEYIVIDGGSTDNSMEVIEKYKEQLHYYVSEPDNGMYEAVQKGFDQSTGEIMAYLNSDDLYSAKALFAVAKTFNQFPDINWILGCPTQIDKDGIAYHISDNSYPLWSKYRYYAYNYRWIQQESVFWKRDLWDRAGSKMNTDLKYAGDTELWMRFFRYDKLYEIPYYLSGHRITGQGQLSFDHIDEYRSEIEDCIRNELKSMQWYIPILSKLIWLDKVLIRIPIINEIYYRTGLRGVLKYPRRIKMNILSSEMMIN